MANPKLAIANTEEEESSDSGNDSRSNSDSGTMDGRTMSSDSSEEIAKRETQSVFYLRMLVLLVLCAAAAGISVVVWLTTSNAEQEEFETNFNGVALKVLRSFEDIVGQKLGAVAGLGVSCTAYARSVKAEWPFVTMNDFQQRSASARSLSGALFMELLPIVTGENRPAWEEYAVANKGWLDEGRAYQKSIGMDLFATAEGDTNHRSLSSNETAEADPNVLNFVTGDSGDSPIGDKIWRFGENWSTVPQDDTDGPFFPIWSSSPIIVAPRELANWDVLSYPDYAPYVEVAAATGQATFGGIDVANPGNITADELTPSFYAFLLSYAAGEPADYLGDPMSSFYIPVFDNFDEDRRVVAVILGVLQWGAYFEGVLPSTSPALTVVLENTCQGPYTYKVSPKAVEFVGQGDLHDTKYSGLYQTTNFSELSAKIDEGGVNLGLEFNQGLCEYTINVYASQEFEDAFKTSMPVVITITVAAVFCFAIFMFFIYDRLVERRQNIVLDTAKKTTAIVSQLFPAQIKERLMEQAQGGDGAKKLSAGGMNDIGGKPLADLFLETTVVFADIAGFTAWSSTREPSQVFTLLETLYQSFDKIAKRRRIYKVETVGDCYVAVCGLPEARADHAPAMCRFAADIVSRFRVLTKELEVKLGPGTGELGLRVGLHSGQVTAGVLRGERARFQLFGDTMNTASRIESAGLPGRVHCSMETAELLRQAGKEVWLEKRSGTITAKGIGCLETFWVNVHGAKDESNTDLSSNAEQDMLDVSMNSQGAYVKMNDKKKRLIDWNVEMLLGLLKEIVAARDRSIKPNGGFTITPKSTPLEEVKEIIALPEFDRRKRAAARSVDSVEIPKAVVHELRDYVTAICNLYRDNPFHSFEHASHVMMSVTKTLSRIVLPDSLEAADLEDQDKISSKLHDNTYGITSDPLTHFACAFSALIHDADHTGVSNAQLVKENDPLCSMYSDRSVAEQNSLDLSWNMLMMPHYRQLRDYLVPCKEEMTRFRQLVVNSVMATDICDADLKNLRNSRWDKAFKKGDHVGHVDANPRDEVNRKATIIIEHIIQASDISHTMQHWHIYRKWNQNLYSELYVAYLNGRMAQDPAEFWFKGEIGFFDFYIIPLTKKLKDCGVFGKSSGEYLNYALKNREEWVSKGEGIVEEMIQIVREKYGVKDGFTAPRAALLPTTTREADTETQSLTSGVSC